MIAIVSALPAITTHLRRLESGLIIPATTGIRTFVTQRDMFPGYFDEDFIEYGTDVPSVVTDPTLSDLYEITENGSIRNIIGSFNTNIEPLFWRSQDQILTWVENYPHHLHPQGWATFFPFIVGKKHFVASVYRDLGELRACVDPFGFDGVLNAEDRYRLVLPQLGV